MDKKNLIENLKVITYTVLIALGISLILTFVAQRTVVSGNSMYPTVKDGESVLVNKLAYKVGDVERFDVVIFPYYNEITGTESYYIKRVIGLPGEMIQIDNSLIYIDGEVLDENYGCYDETLPFYNGIASEPIYIGEDEYFVLGDNRNNSDDSRTFGIIKKEELTGKALITIYPFSEFGVVK